MTSGMQASVGIIAASAPKLALSDRAIDSSAAFPAVATSAIGFDGVGGDLFTFLNGAGTNRSPEWDTGFNPDPPGSIKFYIRCTPMTGVNPEGGSAAINTMLLLSGQNISGRSWSMSKGTVGAPATASWKIEIFWGNSGPLVASAIYSLSAQSVPP